MPIGGSTRNSARVPPVEARFEEPDEERDRHERRPVDCGIPIRERQEGEWLHPVVLVDVHEKSRCLHDDVSQRGDQVDVHDLLDGDAPLEEQVNEVGLGAPGTPHNRMG